MSAKRRILNADEFRLWSKNREFRVALKQTLLEEGGEGTLIRAPNGRFLAIVSASEMAGEVDATLSRREPNPNGLQEAQVVRVISAPVTGGPLNPGVTPAMVDVSHGRPVLSAPGVVVPPRGGAQFDADGHMRSPVLHSSPIHAPGPDAPVMTKPVLHGKVAPSGATAQAEVARPYPPQDCPSSCSQWANAPKDFATHHAMCTHRETWEKAHPVPQPVLVHLESNTPTRPATPEEVKQAQIASQTDGIGAIDVSGEKYVVKEQTHA